METEGQTLHVIGPDLGLDNQGFDLPSDWDDVLNTGETDGCREAEAYAALGQATFESTITYTHHTLGQGHDSLTHEGQSHRLLNGLSDCQLNQQHHQQQHHPHHQHPHQHHHHHQQQQQQQQIHQYQQSLQHQHQQQSLKQQQHQQQQQQDHQRPSRHTGHINPAFDHPGIHGQQQQQQQQQQDSYCSLTGQPRLTYEGLERGHINHNCLPDSPPDSSSEPYSPDGNLQTAMTDLKPNLPGSLTSIPQYLNHIGGHSISSSKGTAYGDTAKLRHHQLHHHHPHHHAHSGHPPPSVPPMQLQQQQQQQQIPPFPPGVNTPLPHQMSPAGMNHTVLSAHLGSVPSQQQAQPSKKRKYSDSLSTGGTMGPADVIPVVMNRLMIKQEPPGLHQYNLISDCSGDEDMSFCEKSPNGSYLDSPHQVIKWSEFRSQPWVVLLDEHAKELPTPFYRVEADKGFNFSGVDEAFVCQKKNHFQVTVHIRLHGPAKYVRIPESGERMKIDAFCMHFYGVKLESENQRIKIERSESDRSKRPYDPERVDLGPDKEFSAKLTVGRLHFSETTNNNMRKKGKPNPEQRYFLLVVSLQAHCGDSSYMVAAHVSDRIIVRASNPGQFENESDVLWQKGQTQESVYHVGKVGVNTDHPDEAFTVHGNMLLTGMLKQPSDMRVKENIKEVDSRSQLENVSKLRIVGFQYNDSFADHMGIPPAHRADVGVLAQDVQMIWPDAVHETGDVILPNGKTITNFKVINKERIFTANVAATQELRKVTDNLGNRVTQLERTTKKRIVQRVDSFKSTTSTRSSISVSTLSTYSTTSVASTPKKERQTDVFKSSSDKKPEKIEKSKSHKSSRHQRNQGDREQRANNSTSDRQKPTKRCLSTRALIITLVAIMLLIIVTIVTLFLLMLLTNNPNSSESQPSLQTNDGAIVANNTTVSTVTLTTLGVTINSPNNSKGSTHRPSGQQPIVPPYPPCQAPYCESLCCPPPGQDRPSEPIVIIHHGEDGPEYHTGEGGGSVIYPSGDKNIVVPSQKKATDKDLNRIVVDIPIGKGSNHSSTPQYHVISNHVGPKYSVINNNGEDNNYYFYRRRRRRRRRGTGVNASRPVIRIVELNYTLGDEFCLQDGCRGDNSYSYYIPLNSTFGYGMITIELSTESTALMAHCHAAFMWDCPTTNRTNEVIGNNPQETSSARWSLRLGTRYQTTLNFKIIHSLKGDRTEGNPCNQQTNENFLVMTFNLLFQRTC